MECICRVRKRSSPRALTASARVPQAGGRHHLLCTSVGGSTLSKIEDKPGPHLPALNLLESSVNFLESPYLAFHLCSPAGMQFERLGQIYAIPNDSTLDRYAIQDGLKDGQLHVVLGGQADKDQRPAAAQRSVGLLKRPGRNGYANRRIGAT